MQIHQCNGARFPVRGPSSAVKPKCPFRLPQITRSLTHERSSCCYGPAAWRITPGYVHSITIGWLDSITLGRLAGSCWLWVEPGPPFAVPLPPPPDCTKWPP
uniref:Uncharacterized protein n=1 Tax=Anopheles coluzzii TaxID=1518534 RepID=A0A8W7PYG7_ANOCL